MKTTSSTLTHTDESISPQEQQQIAGVDFNQPLRLEKEQQLKLDNESPVAIPIEEKGLPRLLTVTVLTGIIISTVIGGWLAIKPKPAKNMMPTAYQQEKPTSPSETEPDYRAKLALQNQSYDLRKQENITSPPQSQPDNKNVTNKSTEPKVVKVRQTPTPPPPPKRVKTRTINNKPNHIVRSVPQPPPPVKTQTTTPTNNKPTIDPYQQWLALAQLGQTTGTNPMFPPGTQNKSNEQPISTNQKPRLKPSNNETYPVNNSPKLSNNETYPVNNSPTTVPTVSLAFNQNDASNGYTNGEQGILNRQTITDSQPTNRTIPFGSRAKGVISTPLIWDTSNNDPNGQLYRRFAVTLTSDIQDSQNQTTIVAGTMLIVEATTINPQNYLVTASAIAIITKDEYGQIKQYPIPPGTIVIQGVNYQPLIAQTIQTNNGDILKQDILIGSLSALGRIGAVLTQPDSTTTINGNFGTTTTVTNNNDPQIWQAVLDGFFNKVTDRLSQRSEQQISQMLKNPNIAILPVNTQVEVVINGFLSIN